MAGTALVAATMLVAGGALAADKKMMKPSISVNGYADVVIGGILNEEQEVGRRGRGEGHVGARQPHRRRNPLQRAGRDRQRPEVPHARGAGRPERCATGRNNDDLIDEYFVSVSGSFGQIIIGGTGGAPIKMLTGL